MKKNKPPQIMNSKKDNHRAFQTAIRTLFLWLFWMSLWHVASQLINQPLLLPSPLQTIRRLGELAKTWLFWQTIGSSLLRVVIGFLLGLMAGIILAILSYMFPLIREILRPFFFVIQSTPVASFTVLFILWVSGKYLSIVVSFFMVLPIIYTHMYTGLQSANKELLEMASLFQVKPMAKIKGIYMYAILPHMLAAVELAMAFAFKSGVAAEIIGHSQQSIGLSIYNAKILLDTESLFAWTMAIILISFTTEKLIHQTVKRSSFYDTM